MVEIKQLEPLKAYYFVPPLAQYEGTSPSPVQLLQA